MALRQINVDTQVSTLTRRGCHYSVRLVTLRRKKQGYLSENPTQDQRGSNPERMSGARTQNACMTGEAVRRSAHCAISAVKVVVQPGINC